MFHVTQSISWKMIEPLTAAYVYSTNNFYFLPQINCIFLCIQINRFVSALHFIYFWSIQYHQRLLAIACLFVGNYAYNHCHKQRQNRYIQSNRNVSEWFKSTEIVQRLISSKVDFELTANNLCDSGLHRILFKFFSNWIPAFHWNSKFWSLNYSRTIDQNVQ